jgi:hypothetical protein
MQPDCSFADDKELAFDAAFYQQIAMNGLFDAARLIDPDTNEIDSGYDVGKTPGDSIRRHPPDPAG